jgi:hypothetical protein
MERDYLMYETDRAYYECLEIDKKKEIEKNRLREEEKEKARLEEMNRDPPKPTKEELRALRLQSLSKKPI